MPDHKPVIDVGVDGKSYGMNTFTKKDDSPDKRKLGFNGKVTIDGKRFQINAHMTEITKQSQPYYMVESNPNIRRLTTAVWWALIIETTLFDTI